MESKRTPIATATAEVEVAINTALPDVVTCLLLLMSMLYDSNANLKATDRLRLRLSETAPANNVYRRI
jgi:hypothetical protein